MDDYQSVLKAYKALRQLIHSLNEEGGYSLRLDDGGDMGGCLLYTSPSPRD